MSDATEKLDHALRAYDESTRPDRIQRNVWLSQHADLPSAIFGRTETLQLLRETREVFINGQFAATLVLAISVINHSLIEELQIRGEVDRDPGLKAVLEKSEMHEVIPVEWIASIRRLVSLRHPFVHLKEPDHEHGLGVRIREERAHPAALLERDAQDAIMFMFRVFRATLREARFE